MIIANAGRFSMNLYYPFSAGWIKNNQKNRLKKEILKCDILSLDIFDTTIIRCVEYPTDIFTKMEQRSFCKEIGFSKDIRVNSQITAKKQYGNMTDISYIYEVIKKRLGCSKEDIGSLIQIELETEARYSFANEIVLEIIKFAEENKKKIVFVSDMYLNKKYLQILLDKVCNLDYSYDVYVSCDYGITKSEGGLFDRVKKDFPGKKIIHIGDNIKSDFLSAIVRKNVHPVWNIYPGKKLSFKDRYIKYNLESRKTDIYCWAFSEIAPGLMGFCRWIDKKAQEDNCKQLVFITREGEFLRQLFLLYDIGKKYRINTLYVSRRSILGSSADTNWDCLAKTYKHGTIGHFLNAFNIAASEINDKLKLDNENDFYKEISKYKDAIMDYSKEQKEMFLSYISSIINVNENTGFIDVGWKGSSQNFIQNIFRENKYTGKLYGYYLGEFYEPLYNIIKSGYLCSAKDNKYTPHVLNAGFVFENILSPSFGSTLGYYTKEGKVMPVLDTGDTYRDKCILDAQRAILDYFNFVNKIQLEQPGDKELLNNMFKTLNNPSYKMAKCMGNITYKDYGEIKYVARPDSLFRYLREPGKFYYDFHHCGWNSAFCKRLFKLPLPYFKIYKCLKELWHK